MSVETNEFARLENHFYSLLFRVQQDESEEIKKIHKRAPYQTEARDRALEEVKRSMANRRRNIRRAYYAGMEELRIKHEKEWAS